MGFTANQISNVVTANTMLMCLPSQNQFYSTIRWFTVMDIGLCNSSVLGTKRVNNKSGLKSYTIRLFLYSSGTVLGFYGRQQINHNNRTSRCLRISIYSLKNPQRQHQFMFPEFPAKQSLRPCKRPSVLARFSSAGFFYTKSSEFGTFSGSRLSG